jgi:hypothetical protein
MKRRTSVIHENTFDNLRNRVIPNPQLSIHAHMYHAPTHTTRTTHTHLYQPTHARTNTRTHQHTHVPMHTHTRTNTCVRTNTHTHTRTNSPTRTQGTYPHRRKVEERKSRSQLEVWYLALILGHFWKRGIL